MTTAISDIRTVPVGEDLTKAESRLEVLRGMEKMYRVDKPYATGQGFGLGEWAVLGADGKVSRATSTPAKATYLVFGGTDRFDAKATGQVTLVMASQIMAKTSVYNSALSYAVGDYLTVKDLGAGESRLTKHGANEVAVAKVVEVGSDYLVYETMSPAHVVPA